MCKTKRRFSSFNIDTYGPHEIWAHAARATKLCIYIYVRVRDEIMLCARKIVWVRNTDFHHSFLRAPSPDSCNIIVSNNAIAEHPCSYVGGVSSSFPRQTEYQTTGANVYMYIPCRAIITWHTHKKINSYKMIIINQRHNVMMSKQYQILIRCLVFPFRKECSVRERYMVSNTILVTVQWNSGNWTASRLPTNTLGCHDEQKKTEREPSKIATNWKWTETICCEITKKKKNLQKRENR